VVSIHANKILRKTFQRNSIGRIAASRHNPIYQVNIPVGQQVRLGISKYCGTRLSPNVPSNNEQQGQATRRCSTVLPGKDVHHSISVGKSLSSPVQTGTPRHTFAKTCATVFACLAKTSADFRHEVLPGVKKVCCHILLLDTEVS
jgi:hypothetical protein